MKKILAIALFGGGVFGAAHAQFLVYDALSTGATVAFNHLGASATTSIEAGDQVLLSAPSTITQANIVIQFNDDGSATNFVVNDTLTFRNVVGTGNTATISTGTPIYQATYSIGGSSGLAPGAYNVGFGIPNVAVPQEFIVTDTFTRVSGNTGVVGEHFNNSAPAVGFSDTTYFWENNSGTWAHFSFGTPPSGNMRMSLTAVPEPASMAALGIGVLALIRRRRSRKA